MQAVIIVHIARIDEGFQVDAVSGAYGKIYRWACRITLFCRGQCNGHHDHCWT